MKHKWPRIALALLLLVLLGSVIHHHLQTSAQNKTFQETQTWLRGAMDDVVKGSTGSKRVSDPYCRRPSAKFEQTERQCVTKELVTYPVEKNKINQAVINIQEKFSHNQGLEFKNMGSNELTNQIIAYSFARNGLDCFISYYELDNENGISYSSKIRESYAGLLVSASCSGPAMADYFPNKD